MYTDDDTESYDTMNTHMRQPDDFFYHRYTQNLNCPHVGPVVQNTLCFGEQSDYTDRDLYAPNDRGAGRGATQGAGHGATQGAGRGGNRGARRGQGARAPCRGGAQPQRGHVPNRPGIRHGVRPLPVPPPVPET